MALPAVNGNNGNVTPSVYEERKKNLNTFNDRISQLAYLNINEFFISSKDAFEIYKDTFCSRIFTCFHSREESLDALDQLISKCAKIMEMFRLDFHSNEAFSNIESDSRLLQRIHSNLEDLHNIGLENLKTSWNDPESLAKIEALKSKISILNNTVTSFNNLMTLIKKNKKSSNGALLNGCTNDKYLDEFVINLYRANKGSMEPSCYFSKTSVAACLNSRFGDSMTRDILRMYSLDQTEFLSSNDLKALFIGIAANVTEPDILYIREHNQDIMKFKPTDTPIDCLNRIRSLHRFSNQGLSSLKNTPYYSQLKKDRQFLKKISWIDNLNLAENHLKTASLNHFAPTEYLCRKVVYPLFNSDEYASFREGTLVPVPDYSKGSKEIILMQAHQLQSRKGLHCLALIPCDLEGKKYPEGIPVQILFRGSHNNAAWIRNLNPLEKDKIFSFEGPGNKSFKRRKKFILKKLDRVLEKLPKDASLKINVMGHSLGSSDSQRMCEALAQHIYQAKDLSPLNHLNVNEVNFFGYNSPGIEDKINESFLEYAAKIPETQFQLRYFKAHRDLVQRAGGCFLGSHSRQRPLPPNVRATIIKFRQPNEAFGWNPAKRYALVPHLQYNLCAWKKQKKKIPNDIWIEKIRTNNPKDEGLVYQGLNPNNPPLKAVVDDEKIEKSLRLRTLFSKLYKKGIEIIQYIGRLFMDWVAELLNKIADGLYWHSLPQSTQRAQRGNSLGPVT